MKKNINNEELIDKFEDYYKLDIEEDSSKKSVKNICIDCKSINLIVDYKSGNDVCMDCGQVNRFIIDNNPE